MTISKTIVENELCAKVVEGLNLEGFTQVANRSFKTIVTDMNGIERLVEVKIVVGKAEEERTARERLTEECDKWQAAKDKAAAKVQERAEKAARDKAERKRKAEEKKGQ